MFVYMGFGDHLASTYLHHHVIFTIAPGLIFDFVGVVKQFCEFFHSWLLNMHVYGLVYSQVSSVAQSLISFGRRLAA